MIPNVVLPLILIGVGVITICMLVWFPINFDEE
jgi:hypothetical protein